MKFINFALFNRNYLKKKHTGRGNDVRQKSAELDLYRRWEVWPGRLI